jgi:hypothetical protein
MRARYVPGARSWRVAALVASAIVAVGTGVKVNAASARIVPDEEAARLYGGCSNMVTDKKCSDGVSACPFTTDERPVMSACSSVSSLTHPVPCGECGMFPIASVLCGDP